MKTISVYFDVVKGPDSDTLWSNFAKAIQENSKKFPSLAADISSCTKVRETDTIVTYFWEKQYKEKEERHPLLPEKTEETKRTTSIVTKYKYDSRTEYKNQFNQLHREDGPAIETDKGDKYWYKNGVLHREYGPAVENSDGTKCWYKNGKLHREYGPAVESPKGDREWWKDGKMQSSYIQPYSTSTPTSTRFTEGCMGSSQSSLETPKTCKTRPTVPRNSETSLEIVYNLEGEIIATNKGI